MRSFVLSFLIPLACLCVGCQTAPDDARQAALLHRDLCALHTRASSRNSVSPDVDREAALLAATAVHEAREISRQFRVVGPAWFHNCLVNTGVRDGGLCWHYMTELYLRLARLEPRYFDLHCGVRDPGRLFLEHHCVALTARGQPYPTGLVLDPWVKGGNLVFFPVRSPGSPWIEDPDFRAWLCSLHRQRQNR